MCTSLNYLHFRHCKKCSPFTLTACSDSTLDDNDRTVPYRTKPYSTVPNRTQPYHNHT